eukprot:1490127-Pleurochrysis_carterae.AAC.1
MPCSEAGHAKKKHSIDRSSYLGHSRRWSNKQTSSSVYGYQYSEATTCTVTVQDMLLLIFRKLNFSQSAHADHDIIVDHRYQSGQKASLIAQNTSKSNHARESERNTRNIIIDCSAGWQFIAEAAG